MRNSTGTQRETASRGEEKVALGEGWWTDQRNELKQYCSWVYSESQLGGGMGFRTLGG